MPPSDAECRSLATGHVSEPVILPVEPDIKLGSALELVAKVTPVKKYVFATDGSPAVVAEPLQLVAFSKRGGPS